VPETIRGALLDWFDRVHRDLPWRRTRDPYAIWVSEVMLQQTRVETVIPYYERFLARFPDVEALADAPEDAVLAQWSGLGYYRRARLLQAGAREVVARYGGAVPGDREARLGLPGVGRYTAGAIGSIAFDRPEPIVDGNVARVLSRLRCIETPLGEARTESRLWDEAERLVLGERPGALNQALMELGATVCTKGAPRCGECPIASACEARRRGEVDRLPIPKARKAPKRLELAAAVAVRGGREVFLVRGREALFGGLYSLPLAERGDDGATAARAALRACGATSGALSRRGHLEHVLSHRRLDVEVFRGDGGRATKAAEGRFVPLDALCELGISRLTAKLLELAGLPTRLKMRAPSGRGAP
jgi:A/G-specific adenine glycosylase